MIFQTGMRTEINKKRGRPERSEEARAKGAKRGKNSWGVGVGGGALKGWGLKFIIVKNAISLHEMQDIPDR